MKRVLKWIGIVLGGLIGLLVIAIVAVFLITNARFNKRYELNIEQVAVPSDAEALARGEHIAQTRGCTDCHGPQLAGITFIEDPAIGSLYSSNLTAGVGGVGSVYTDQDWVGAIRHGVEPNGKPLLFMPAQEFYYLSDSDLGALIAYLKSVPPVDNEPPEDSVGPLGRVLFLAGALPLLPVELIDHDAPRPDAPEPGVTVEYGGYLAVGCTGCHGENYAGGPIAGPPDAPMAANLTPAGNLTNWTEADFIQTIRTGVTPEGHQLDGEWMPYETVGRMTDDELKAIWLFLQSLPPVESEAQQG